MGCTVRFKRRAPEFALPGRRRVRSAEGDWAACRAASGDNAAGRAVPAAGSAGAEREACPGIDTYGPAPALAIAHLAGDERCERRGAGRAMASFAVAPARRLRVGPKAGWQRRQAPVLRRARPRAAGIRVCPGPPAAPCPRRPPPELAHPTAPSTERPSQPAPSPSADRAARRRAGGHQTRALGSHGRTASRGRPLPPRTRCPPRKSAPLRPAPRRPCATDGANHADCPLESSSFDRIM